MWSEFQERIFEGVQASSNHTVVQAYAGSGKTTTLVELTRRMPGRKRVVAFNKTIATELEVRVPSTTKVSTFHSYGLRTVRSAFPNVAVDPQKGARIALEVASDHGISDAAYDLMRTASLFKAVLPTTRAEAVKLASDESLVSPAYECLRRAVQDTSQVDYDDMLYFPTRLLLTPEPVDTLLVDEMQDMSTAQLYLVLASGSRIVGFGDRHQAIYAFRGAGDNVLDTTAIMLAADRYELPITYRCPKQVVEKVRSTFGLQSLRAHEDAPEGAVREATLAPQLGDFVVSRLNAPLVDEALRLAKAGVPVRILGFNIVSEVERLFREAPYRTSKIVDWADEQFIEVARQLHAENRTDELPRERDRYALVATLAHDVRTGTKHDCIERLRKLFEQRPDTKCVTLTNTHKVKGLEADNVWVVHHTFRPLGASVEEDNLRYVAYTRARNELNIVH